MLANFLRTSILALTANDAKIYGYHHNHPHYHHCSDYGKKKELNHILQNTTILAAAAADVTPTMINHC